MLPDPAKMIRADALLKTLPCDWQHFVWSRLSQGHSLDEMERWVAEARSDSPQSPSAP